jgi:hypothetical protein
MTAYRFEGPGQKAIEHLLSVHPLCNAPDAALQAERWGDVTLVLVDDDWGWGSGEHALFAYIFPVLARNITTALRLAASSGEPWTYDEPVPGSGVYRILHHGIHITGAATTEEWVVKRVAANNRREREGKAS